jgi:hypothetical protein
MLIQSLIEDVSALIHKGKSYPVINGIADVPEEVRDEVISYFHWKDATDEIDKKTLTALEKANKTAEKESSAPNPAAKPPDLKKVTEKK